MSGAHPPENASELDATSARRRLSWSLSWRLSWRLSGRLSERLSWLRSGLLWRTFFLLALLITLSMAAWVAVFNLSERTPRANQVAAKVVSIVTITRAALTHSAPERMRELLFNLASNEGLRIFPLEDTDMIEALPDNALMREVQASVRRQLGQTTKFGGAVNDMSGFWISFVIDEDEYWLMLDRDPVESTGVQFLVWAGVTLFIALLGAMGMSRLINQPIARLASAAQVLARGLRPEPLPETGPAEIRAANHSFNQMVTDLERIDADRTVILAGISHDLRTPITRMLLEVEMTDLPEATRRDMQADLTQMDAIIGQFLDYARPTEALRFTEIDLSTLLSELVDDALRYPDVQMQTEIEPSVTIKGNQVELKRVFANLLENARRYGKTPHGELTEIELRLSLGAEEVQIEFADHGIGIPAHDEERLLRPFTRLDEARSQANGAGLGLAIVDRIVRRHGGKVKLGNRPGGGMLIRLSLPR